jgi:hypothetical protein
MSVSAELEIPYQGTPDQATKVKVCVHSSDYNHYMQHKLDFGEALKLLSDLTEAMRVHREATNAQVDAAKVELACHVEERAAA